MSEQPERQVPAETTPRSPVEEPPAWSDQTFVLWGRTDDGSSFLAIIDPEPPEEAAAT